MLYWLIGGSLANVGMFMAEIRDSPHSLKEKTIEKKGYWLESWTINIVRIHVERVIGSLKQKHTILQSILPVHFCDSGDTLSVIDEVVHVCCAQLISVLQLYLKTELLLRQLGHFHDPLGLNNHNETT